MGYGSRYQSIVASPMYLLDFLRSLQRSGTKVGFADPSAQALVRGPGTGSEIGRAQKNHLKLVVFWYSA